MISKMILIMLFLGLFATIGYAQGNETVTQNITNVTLPITTVGCVGRCSYFWGTVENTLWLPNMFIMTGIGNCSFASVQTDSFNKDSYSFSCSIPLMNMTDTQEFIFHMLDGLNGEINSLRSVNATAAKSEADKNATFWISTVIIIALVCVIGCFVYRDFW